MDKIVTAFPILGDLYENDDRDAALISPREASYKHNERYENSENAVLISAALEAASDILETAQELKAQQGRSQGREIPRSVRSKKAGRES